MLSTAVLIVLALVHPAGLCTPATTVPYLLPSVACEYWTHHCHHHHHHHPGDQLDPPIALTPPMRSRSARLSALGVSLLVASLLFNGLIGDDKPDWWAEGPYSGWKDEYHRPISHSDRGILRADDASHAARTMAPITGTEKNSGSNNHPAEEGGPERGPGMVELYFMGRLGNNLFEYAAARSLADRMGWALSLQPASWNRRKFDTLLRPDGKKCFPGVREIGPSRDSPEMKALQQVEFRSFNTELADRRPRRIVMQNWFQEYRLFSADADRLRQVCFCGILILYIEFIDKRPGNKKCCLVNQVVASTSIVAKFLFTVSGISCLVSYWHVPRTAVCRDRKFKVWGE